MVKQEQFGQTQAISDGLYNLLLPYKVFLRFIVLQMRFSRRAMQALKPRVMISQNNKMRLENAKPLLSTVSCS